MLIQEWKNLFKNKILVLSLIVLALIPIIYAGILLSSYWDPFGKTSNLKIAVVNNDIPKEFEGKELQVGDELVKNLKTNSDFEWVFVDSKDALKGYQNGDYYMIITIPKEFSENASSVLNDNVEKMKLEYKINPGRNYFAETISKQAIDNLNKEISTSVTKEYTKAVFSTIEEIGEGFQEASDGSKELKDGTEELKNGSSELTSNLLKLSSSTLSFQSGSEKLEVGVSELIKNVNKLNEGSTSFNESFIKFTNGIDSLNNETKVIANEENGFPKLAIAQNSLNENINSIYKNNKNIENSLIDLNSSIPSSDTFSSVENKLSELQNEITKLENLILSDTSSSEELKSQLNSLTTITSLLKNDLNNSLNSFDDSKELLNNSIIPTTNELNKKFSSLVSVSNQINSSTSEFAQKIPLLSNSISNLNNLGSQLKYGSTSISVSINELDKKLPALHNGIRDLSIASGSIHSASNLLADGSSEINNGLSSLYDGTDELSTKLSDASEDVNSINMEDNNYDMFSSPVETIAYKDNDVPNYGHALAPNFISLALFIGAIAFNLIYPISIASKKPSSARSWWFSKFSIIFIQSLSAALILDFILLAIIGLEVSNKPLFVLVSILVSLASMSLVSFLVIAFNNPGRFIATIFMVLQLASSGGMFPTELQSSFFQTINPFMLMTYSVFSFRESMTGAVGNDVFSTSIIILISTIVLANVFMLIAMFIKMKLNKTDENTTI